VSPWCCKRCPAPPRPAPCPPASTSPPQAQYDRFGHYKDPLLCFACARALVNLTVEPIARMLFIDPSLAVQRLQAFRRPFDASAAGRAPKEGVDHAIKLAAHESEEGMKLGCCLLVNLSGLPELQEALFLKGALDVLIERVGGTDVDVQKLAAAAVWNISKHAEVLRHIKMKMNVTETLERFRAPGPDQISVKTLFESIPIVLAETTLYVTDWRLLLLLLLRLLRLPRPACSGGLSLRRSLITGTWAVSTRLSGASPTSASLSRSRRSTSLRWPSTYTTTATSRPWAAPPPSRPPPSSRAR
jgi:hypothetical protein